MKVRPSECENPGRPPFGARPQVGTATIGTHGEGSHDETTQNAAMISVGQGYDLVLFCSEFLTTLQLAWIRDRKQKINLDHCGWIHEATRDGFVTRQIDPRSPYCDLSSHCA